MVEAPFVFEYKNYPLIPIKFFIKNRETPMIDALLDSGGDFIVIPYAIAKYLKLKLDKAGCVDTAAGETTLYKTVLNMVILLGRSPIFEDHEIIFQKHQNKLILQPIPHQ